MSSPFDEAKYNALLKGLEVSVVRFSELNKIQNRFDAEFYSKENLALEHLLQKVEYTTLSLLHCEIDCSAFYPGITQYYNFDKSGIPFIRVNELQDGFVKITDSTAFLPKNVLLENSKTIAMAYPDDIVIAKGGNTLAKVGILTNEYSEYAICRDVLLIRTNNLNFNQKYNIWAFLHSSVGYKLMVKTASQTGQPHLTVPNIASLKMPKWIETDTRFSDCYISAQSLIQKSKSLYAQAEDTLLSELGLKDWQPKNEAVSIKSFSDFASSGRLDAEYYQRKYDDIENAIKAYKGGYFNFGETIDYIFTGEYAEEYKSKASNLIFYVRSLNMKNGRIETDDSHYVSPELFKKVVKTGNIVTARVGTIGVFAEIDETLNNAACSDNILCFNFPSQYNPAIYTMLLNSKPIFELVDRLARGSVQQRLNQETLKNLILPILPQETQESIAELIQKSFALRAESKRLLEEAKKMVEAEIDEGAK